MNKPKSKPASAVSAAARLRQDYLRLKKDPLPYITAEPLPSNLLEWHYAVEGPEKSLYEGGIYHGKLVFPSQYPFKPPAIYMITPNGRFAVQQRLCLSISDFHPDTWNPSWSLGSILTGLLSFMLETSPTLGSVQTTDSDKRQYALKSLEFNLKDKVFTMLFPDLVKYSKDELKKRQEIAEAYAKASNSSTPSSSTASSSTSAGRAESYLDGAITNFLMIGGFAAFAFLVKHVLQSIDAGT